MWGKRKSDHDQEAPAAGGVPLSPQAASANEQLLETQALAGSDPKPKFNGAEPNATNGVDGTEASAAPNRAVQGPNADEIRFAVTFTRIVSVLSRSPHYKHYTLSDLEWLVVPPILTGQCALMEAQVNGRKAPVAVALWASVSAEVDRRLSESLTTLPRLRPDEWRSGDTLWLIDGVGDPQGLQLLLTQLQGTAFKMRQVKVRAIGSHPKTVAELLQSGTRIAPAR